MKRVLVTGGRNYSNRSAVYSALDAVLRKSGISLLIHGDARGADTLAKDWAISRGVGHLAFPVTPEMWRMLGKRAGSSRNERMLQEGRPDGVVAFPGGKGTDDMVSRAASAGVPIMDLRRHPSALSPGR